MRLALASVALLSSIWLPAILDEFQEQNKWIQDPMIFTFITLYLLSFGYIALSFVYTAIIQRRDSVDNT
jgi:hypothetical protein